MRIIDPDQPGTDSGATDPADAAAGGAELTTEQKAIAAFDEGAAEADDPAPAPAPQQSTEEGQTDDDSGEGDGGAGEGAPDGAGEGEGESDEQREERERAEAEAAAKAEDDKAVQDLGLKGKAEERFRELTGRVRDLSQKLESVGGDDTLKLLTDLGGKEGLERTVRDAQDQRQWDQKLHEIGCTPQQFGQAMGLIQAINTDDPNVLRQAREHLLKEVALLDSRLGEKTDRHDPLEAHPDLKSKVIKGAMDEEDALEIARLRDQTAAGQQRNEQQTAQQQAQAAQAQATEGLAQLGEVLKKKDGPALFQAKMASIAAALNAAIPDLPPEKWVAHARKLYDGVRITPPAQSPQPPRVGKQPVRQSHATTGAAGGGAIHPNTPKNPWDAFDQGVTEAREQGL